MNKREMLKQLIEHYEEGNKTRFAKRLGISPQGVSTWLSRGTIDYELVYAKCEHLNADWLLSGKGPMLHTDGALTTPGHPYTDTSNEGVSYSEAVTLRFMDKIDEKDHIIKEKETKIDQLQSELRSMGEELVSVKAKLSQYESQEHPDISGSSKTAKGADTKPHSSTSAPSAGSASYHPKK